MASPWWSRRATPTPMRARPVLLRNPPPSQWRRRIRRMHALRSPTTDRASTSSRPASASRVLGTPAPPQPQCSAAHPWPRRMCPAQPRSTSRFIPLPHPRRSSPRCRRHRPQAWSPMHSAPTAACSMPARSRRTRAAAHPVAVAVAAVAAPPAAEVPVAAHQVAVAVPAAEVAVAPCTRSPRFVLRSVRSRVATRST